MVGQKIQAALRGKYDFLVSILFLMDGGPEDCFLPTQTGWDFPVSILFLMDGGPEDKSGKRQKARGRAFQSFS